MRIGRTLPPAAAPIYIRDIVSGLKGLFRGHRELNRFEVELKAYFDVKHCFLVSSGKAALTLILQALKDLYPNRDEVLIPAFTCYSVPSAIVRAGLKVKLCDIDPDTLDFDYTQLSKILSQALSRRDARPQSSVKQQAARNQQPVTSNRLLAIIPAHLFGLPADIQRLREMVEDPQVVIIEDAAQTMGAEWKGKKLGTLGDIGFFSLGRGKALSAVEGGIILTDHGGISDRIRHQIDEVQEYKILEIITLIIKGLALTVFQHPTLFCLPKSLPFLKIGDTIYDPHFKIRKMSAFQAGLTNGWQQKVEKFKKIRRKNAKHWASLLEEKPIRDYFFEKATVQKTHRTPITQATRLPDLLRFPVTIDDDGLRTRVLRKSDQMGLGVIFTYPDSINRIPELKQNYAEQDFPVAKELAVSLITLPAHPFVSEKDKAQISALVSEMANQESSVKQEPK